MLLGLSALLTVLILSAGSFGLLGISALAWAVADDEDGVSVAVSVVASGTFIEVAGTVFNEVVGGSLVVSAVVVDVAAVLVLVVAIMFFVDLSEVVATGPAVCGDLSINEDSESSAGSENLAHFTADTGIGTAGAFWNSFFVATPRFANATTPEQSS